jgi:hypothetical protein
MIDSLTEGQIAQFGDYVDEWVGIGLSTDSINMEVVKPIIADLYKAGGLTVPDEIKLCKSPFEAVEVMKDEYGIKVNTQDFVYGSHDAEWMSFFGFWETAVGITGCEKMHPLMDLAKNSGWALFYDELVVLTERPCKINFDDQNRTHCEDDFAIKYPDGKGVAVWHGQRIPEEWVFDKSTITPDICLHWENIEQRRCACEILGWGNVIKMLDAKVLDKDDDETIGSLVEVELPDVGTEKFLLALDPNTNNLVGLPVPPEMTTALEANSWTYGIDKYEFKPAFRV